MFYEFVEQQLKLSFDQAVVSRMLSEYPVKLMVIHDKADALVPIENAHRISSSNKDSRLHLTEERGHYRILWDEEVINQTRNFLAQKDNDQMKSSINFFTQK
jgi:pimeloyl-ACP methyl ester carboxylesterase